MNRTIRCILISVGDEILYGQIHNTNVHYLSGVLTDLGIRVTSQLTLPDQADVMLEEFKKAEQHHDLTIITGGLGPTADDLTKPILAEMYNSEMHLNREALEAITELFKQRGRELTELNKQQALLPDACEYMPNRLGTAPGMWFQREGKVVVSLPGVPYEMQTLMEEQVIPRIKSMFSLPVIYHRMIRTAGIPESKLAAMIKEWEDQLPNHIRLAYLPRLGQVRLRLTAFGEDQSMLEADVQKEVLKVLPIIDKYVYGFDGEELEAVVGKKLIEKGWKLSSAESCTGGFVAHKITSVPGSSRYFMGTVVPYHNEYKQNIIHVNAETLKKHGAVSEECVREMVEGVCRIFGTEVGIATSGIAGPDGGTPEKPVGTVWLAIKTPSGIKSRLLNLTKDRTLNIELTATASLYMLWREIQFDMA